MCGIVGYVGAGESVEILLGGLRRLEYRGYDSAGIAVIDSSGSLHTRKRAGKLTCCWMIWKPFRSPNGPTGIGHTRWATHGGPTDCNAHPHLGDDGRLALIHNGIIENFAELKAELLSNHPDTVFTSETDSEVAALMVGYAYRETGDITEALRRVVARLHGAFTLLVLHQDQPGVVVGARRNSPLVIGLGDGENFLGSDASAFIEHTRRAMAIGQDQLVTITPDSVEVTDFDGNTVATEEFEVAWDASAAEKGGWTSFMAKEISEEPESIANTLLGRIADDSVSLAELDGLDEVIAGVDRIVILGCGTAAYSGMLGKYAIEKWARIPVEVELSHEFRYRDPVLDAKTLVVSISQSGETMDTLMAVKYAVASGCHTLSICNTQGATIARESDAVLYTHAGPEVAVASTKAFVAQVAALYLLGLHLAGIRGTLTQAEIADSADRIASDPGQAVHRARTARGDRRAGQMDDGHEVRAVPRPPRRLPGRARGGSEAQGARVHPRRGIRRRRTQARPDRADRTRAAGLRHGAEPAGRDALHNKVVSNIQEIRARGARVLAIAELGDASVLPYADVVITIPFTSPMFEPLLAVAPLQIFAMELAAAKGLDVDQPRNLAKSVTVE